MTASDGEPEGAGGAGGAGITGASDGSRIGRASAVMAAGGLASRVLGVLRQSLIAVAIGQGLVANAFTTANNLPNVIYLVIAGGVLNSVLIPQLVKASRAADGGRDYTDRLITITVMGFIVITVLATSAAALLVKMYAASLTGSLFELAVFFAVITLPQIFFYGMYGLLGQVLNARGQFAAFGWAPAAANLVAIAGLLSFMRLFQGHVTAAEWTPAMVWWFAGTPTLSIVVQALILIVPLWRSGFRWRPRFGVRGVGLGTTSRMAGWALASLLVAQLGYVLTSQLLWRATGSDEMRAQGAGFVAGNAIWANAILVFMVPHGLVTVSLLTAMYPRISAAVHDRDLASLRSDYVRGLTMPAAITLPFSVAFIVFALPIMGLLYSSRDPAEVPAAAMALAFVAMGIMPFGVETLNQRYFYAYETGPIALGEQLIVTGTAASISLTSLLAPPQWAAPIIGCGLVVGNILASAFGMWRLRLRIGDYDARGVLVAWGKMLLAAIGAGLVAWVPVIALTGATATWGRMGYAVTLLIAGVMFATVYWMLSTWLQITQVDSYLAAIIGKLDRRPAGRHRPRGGDS
ncbi:MAG: lipid II flippase MurJ [Dermatophilaceae bacterium]